MPTETPLNESGNENCIAPDRKSPSRDKGTASTDENDRPSATQHTTLKYHLLGPSLTKSGQDNVDQSRVSEIIYNASKGSRFFVNEVNKDKTLTQKISRILAKKRHLETLNLKADLRRADELIARQELSRDLSQVIVHVDCDAFYAAVEELDRPELKTVPFAVGKGVITTCNYEARKFGIRSAMAGFVADKLCPGLIHIPLNFEKYMEKAKQVRAVLERYDPGFESASIDEAYLNFTEYCARTESDPESAVAEMCAQVAAECGITISAGIAANTKLAKIASNRNKPNGQFYLAPERTAIMAFMRDLPTRKVNGVGRVFERELDAIGIKTCGDIDEHRAYLARLFGTKAFEFLIGVYLGLGRTDVRPAEEYERKSVGTESTFHDMSDPSELREKLCWIAEELEKDLKRTGFKGRTLVLKIKLHTYEVITRQVIPPKAVHTADDLYKFSLPMLAKLESEMPKLTLRLMGLRCTHLVNTKKPLDFFGRQQHAGTTNGSSAPSSSSRPCTANDNAGQAEDDGWEKWPDEEFEDAARRERQEDMEDIARTSQEVSESLAAQASPSATTAPALPLSTNETQSTERQAFQERKHDNGFAWRLLLEEEKVRQSDAAADDHGDDQGPAERAAAAVETWACPICGLGQRADDRSFNAHIDACLSRQAIREMVKTSSTEGANHALVGAEDSERVLSGPGPESGPGSGPGLGPSGSSGRSRKRSSDRREEPKGGDVKRPKSLFFA